MTYDKTVCLLDMDGVLFNFVQSTIDLLNKDLGCHIKHEDIKDWNIHKAFGLTAGDMWKRIDNEGPDFWANLELYPWAKELVSMLEHILGDNIYFCSSPSMSPWCLLGKRQSIIKHFPKYNTKFVFTNHKQLLANKDTILIDDSLKNCAKFEDAGGVPILFGQPWNCPVDNLTPLIRIRIIKKALHYAIESR